MWRCVILFLLWLQSHASNRKALLVIYSISRLSFCCLLISLLRWKSCRLWPPDLSCIDLFSFLFSFLHICIACTRINTFSACQSKRNVCQCADLCDRPCLYIFMRGWAYTGYMGCVLSRSLSLQAYGAKIIQSSYRVEEWLHILHNCYILVILRCICDHLNVL